MKLDVLQGRLPVTHELSVELAGFALQCEGFFLFAKLMLKKLMSLESRAWLVPYKWPFLSRRLFVGRV